MLQAQKKKLYVDYHELKSQSRELAIAKHNAQRILDIPLEPQKREDERQTPQAESPEI